MAGIALGNLTVKELEEKHDFTLTDEHRSTLEAMRQDNAQHIEKGKFHIFDMPRTIMCDSMDTMQKVYDILKGYKIKGQVSLTIQGK